MLHIVQSLECEFFSSDFNFSSSAFNVAIYVAAFTTPLEWNNTNFLFACHSNVNYMPCEWLSVKWGFECHANGLRETLSLLSHSFKKAIELIRTASTTNWLCYGISINKIILTMSNSSWVFIESWVFQLLSDIWLSKEA